MTRLLGVDPGLRYTGWGVLDVDGNRIQHVANGVISTQKITELPHRLKYLFEELSFVIKKFSPREMAIEETYVNKNGATTLKLGYARGSALLAGAMANVPISEYGALKVKKAVVGTGRADKKQVETMVRMLLPNVKVPRNDASDALAVGICHAHYRQTAARLF